MIGEASTGAANDLAGATELAIKMVTDWGLSPRLGPDRLRIGPALVPRAVPNSARSVPTPRAPRRSSTKR